MLSSWVVIKTAFGHPRHLAIQMQCIVAPMIQAYGSMLGFLVPQYGHGLVLCHFSSVLVEHLSIGALIL